MFSTAIVAGVPGVAGLAGVAVANGVPELYRPVPVSKLTLVAGAAVAAAGVAGVAVAGVAAAGE